MTHRGPFQPLRFCDSVISKEIMTKHLRQTAQDLSTEPYLIMSKTESKKRDLLKHITKRDFKRRRKGICLNQTKRKANHSGKAL